MSLKKISLRQVDQSRFPKLRHGLDRAGYLKDDNGVAHVDPKALTASTQQETSTSLRRVDFPQKSKKIVSRDAFPPLSILLHEENISQYSP